MCVYIYIYIYQVGGREGEGHGLQRPLHPGAGRRGHGMHGVLGSSQRGVLVKGGLAICAFPLCNCDTLGFVFNVQIEHMPNC